MAQFLLADLEKARRTNTRVLLNLTGPEHYFADDAGFSLAQWKRLVDRFRGLDLTSYIADGTIVGHFLMDEPNDASNWNGKPVSPAEVEEMAKYSKEIWPAMPAIVRAWSDYLIGFHYQYLDAAWAQYCLYCGNSRYRLPIDAFTAQAVRDAHAAGLGLVVGLNVLSGGSGASGIPGRKPGQYAMSAGEIRSWGDVLLREPYICAFFMWKYDSLYFSRPDIKAALLDLNHQAENHPKQACRRQS